MHSARFARGRFTISSASRAAWRSSSIGVATWSGGIPNHRAVGGEPPQPVPPGGHRYAIQQGAPRRVEADPPRDRQRLLTKSLDRPHQAAAQVDLRLHRAEAGCASIRACSSAASERTRERPKALVDGSGESAGSNSDLVRLAARRIIEEAQEREARDAVGRDYYGLGAVPDAGYRNGYRRGRLKSAERPIEYSAPQIADREEPFRSRVRALLGKRKAELETLAVEMYARGLSTRDIEALFADETGRSSVRQVPNPDHPKTGKPGRREVADLSTN